MRKVIARLMGISFGSQPGNEFSLEDDGWDYLILRIPRQGEKGYRPGNLVIDLDEETEGGAP